MLKCFLIDLVNRISSEKKVEKNVGTSKFEYSEGPLGDILKTSRIKLGRPLNVRLGRPLNVISGRQIETSPGRSNRIFRGTSWGCWRGTSLGGPGKQYLPAGLTGFS